MLTLEGVNIETLILPVEPRLLQLLLHKATLGVIGRDDAVFLSLCLELLSNFKNYSSLSRVLSEFRLVNTPGKTRIWMVCKSYTHMNACVMLVLLGVFHMHKPARRH